MNRALTIEPTLHVAREIRAVLKHRLKCEGPEADAVAMELAKFLDRKPEDMLGLRYDELFQAVVHWKLYGSNRKPGSRTP